MDADGPRGGDPRAEDGAPLETPTPRRWRALPWAATALFAFAGAVVVSVAVTLVLGTAQRPADQRSASELLVLTALSDGALVVFLVVSGRYLLRLRLSDLGLRSPSRASLTFAAFSGLALWLVSVLVNAVWIQAFGANPQSLIVSVAAHRGLGALALDLATGAVVAPFAEELLFRGLIFGGLWQRLPFFAAASASALLFAAAHGLAVIAPIFVLGIGLAYVYARTGTIWSSMLAHGLVNAISLLIVFAATPG